MTAAARKKRKIFFIVWYIIDVVRRVLKIAGFMVLILGLGAGVVLVGQRQIWEKRATAGKVNLSLTNPGDINLNQEFDINILGMPDAGMRVTAVKVFMNYPADKLNLISITAGPFFKQNFTAGQTEMLEILDKNTAGAAKITLGAPCTTAAPWQCYPAAGGGVLATLRFRAVDSGEAVIAFDSGNTEVAAMGSAATVLGAIMPATVVITGAPVYSAALSFKLGIAKSARVILKQGTTEILKREVVLTNGQGTLAGIPAGTYDVYVKGFAHLQKNMGVVTFATGQTVTKDWSTTILTPGDAAGSVVAGNLNGPDNRVDTADWQKILLNLSFSPAPDSLMDLNNDGYVNALDLQIIFTNVSFNYGDGGEE